jgi:general stress protein CsbA
MVIVFDLLALFRFFIMITDCIAITFNNLIFASFFPMVSVLLGAIVLWSHYNTVSLLFVLLLMASSKASSIIGVDTALWRLVSAVEIYLFFLIDTSVQLTLKSIIISELVIFNCLLVLSLLKLL